MKYCGIDLHSNNCVVIVSDEQDRVVYQNRLPNDLRQIAAGLEPYRPELTGVVIESTYNWYWLVDGLMDASSKMPRILGSSLTCCLIGSRRLFCA
ncbi:hypothetical protein CI15_25185 [Paraburkholderia monticola]|uniref:Uncharacterized protein n=1 Tax=Paraburkholderia monticola TaxID=1399968 RepID=A0A149PG44_9BURK|nr:hypothetical protein CI15_25185 [Paraburkholderia monticola]